MLHAAREHDLTLEISPPTTQQINLHNVRLHRTRELSVKIIGDNNPYSVEQPRFTGYGVNQEPVEEPHVLNTLQLAPRHPLAEQG
jgi:hypothetical protein